MNYFPTVKIAHLKVSRCAVGLSEFDLPFWVESEILFIMSNKHKRKRQRLSPSRMLPT